MTTITIEQKMSGTGDIYDIASEHFDIEIQFLPNHLYAVVFPAHYNIGYITHADWESAVATAECAHEYHPSILNTAGSERERDGT